jgi:hypothetical protein
VQWYVDNEWWWSRVQSGGYRGERLGLGATVSAAPAVDAAVAS